MNKEDVVHIHNGILLDLMKLEPITQCEVSQNKKNKYILMHIYGI